MKRILYLICLLAFLSPAKAQKFEVGVMAGGSNYLGDLAPKIAWNETHPAGAIFTRHNFSKYFSLRNSFMYASISGSDQNFEFNTARNLSFYSDIYELSSVLEFNFLPFGEQVLTKNFTPYVFAGLGGFIFKPEADYENSTHELRALGTEGQFLNSSKSYGESQVCIPFGGGLKYNLSHKFVVSVEAGWRKTYTDFLDDVSNHYPDLLKLEEKSGRLSRLMSDRSAATTFDTPKSSAGDMRGNPAFKDWYFFTGVTVSFRIKSFQQCLEFYKWRRPTYDL